MIKKTLYKKTSTGAIESWSVWTEGADVISEYGHVDGKMQQARERAVGKNIDRSNETTPEQQAELQAESDYTTKLSRKGYVDSLEKAERGENSGAGGIRPMLAKTFDDHSHKIVFPCCVQAKLDGIRCIAVINADSSVSLWSREQKPIVAVPMIAEAIQSLGLPPGTVVDGELYNHSLKDDFEKISSCVRKQYAAAPEEQALVEYHAYDLPRHPSLKPDASFKQRSTELYGAFYSGSWGSAKQRHPKLCNVPGQPVNNVGELIAIRTLYQKQGYEGAMARNWDSPYEEGKRSVHLQKLKTFLEDDFEIVGVQEGVGKMAGLAVFECKAENGNLFSVKLEGSLDGLRKYIIDDKTWRGKKLSVKYFALTNKNQVPRFPVGKCLRDYE